MISVNGPFYAFKYQETVCRTVGDLGTQKKQPRKGKINEKETRFFKKKKKKEKGFHGHVT